MTLEERLGLLQTAPEIAGLPVATRTGMAAAMDEERFRAGEIILGAGEPADRVLVLAEGAAEVRRRSGVARRLGRGALIGEIAFLTGTARTATVVAVTDCELLSLPFPNLLELLLAHPRAALAVAGRLARQLVEAEALLAEATIGSVAKRT